MSSDEEAGDEQSQLEEQFDLERPELPRASSVRGDRPGPITVAGARGMDFLIAFKHCNAPPGWWGIDCLKCLRIFTNVDNAFKHELTAQESGPI